MAMTLKQEAELLSGRIGLRAKACEAWMRSAGVVSIMDLMRRYPDAHHAEAMTRAAREIEDFICA